MLKFVDEERDHFINLVRYILVDDEREKGIIKDKIDLILGSEKSPLSFIDEDIEFEKYEVVTKTGNKKLLKEYNPEGLEVDQYIDKEKHYSKGSKEDE